MVNFKESFQDDNSLGTEEDLDNYLVELEEEEKRRKEEALEMLRMQKEALGEEEGDKGFKLSANYKFAKKSKENRDSSEEELKEDA